MRGVYKTVLLLVFIINGIFIVGGEPHYKYSLFANPEQRVYSASDMFTVMDSATYRYGYYSVNGSPWVRFNFSGTVYEVNNNWITGDAFFHYPPEIMGAGEHYIAFYSCYREYAWLTDWDCHEGWQLIIFENNLTDAPDPYELVRIEGADFTCGNNYDYQCGTITICGEEQELGTCDEGYECRNNLCIASEDLTCTNITCNNEEYCSRGVCLLNVTGNTYFVATWGEDNNSGTYEEPFYSWQRGAEAARPGDIIYIRGGVWYPNHYIYGSSTIGLIIDPTGYTSGLVGGEEGRPIRFYNYPGEKPILDGSNITTSTTRWLSGISLGQIEHVYLKGLTVRQIHQTPPDFNHGKPYSEVFGIGSGGANLYFENIAVHDIDGRGIQHWSTAWSEQDAEYSVEAGYSDEILVAPFSSDNTTWINCDAYNLFDRYASEPGNAADGWKVGTYYGSTFTWKGCRAWNYSDDGFDPHGSGKRIFDNCWAISGNYFADATPMWGTEGNGFKTTGTTGIHLQPDEHSVIFKNCIAANNYGHGHGTGFITNIVSSNEYTSRPLLYNNFAYYDGWAYSGLHAGIVRNNIAHGTRNIGPTGEIYHIVSGDAVYTESHNTWVANDPRPGSWPWFYVNEDYNVTDEDFVSLDYSQLIEQRKKDFSLPDVTFGHLAQGSDLIDRGVVIEGYHCNTSGAHPDEECVEWYGIAPDLGPFESNYS